MSQENVDALKKALAAPLDDPKDFFAILDEDIVWDNGDQFTTGKAYGHDGVRKFFRQWIGAFDEWHSDPIEFIDAGDSVFVHLRQSGRGKGSGIPAEIDLWQVWLFLEGKVVRMVLKPTREEALEAAGLRE